MLPPVPVKLPTPCDVPFKSIMPPLTVNRLLTLPKVPVPLSRRVPLVMVVPPVYRLAPAESDGTARIIDRDRARGVRDDAVRPWSRPRR